MGSIFRDMRNVLQLMADNMSGFLKLDVEIIDSNLERIACTGFARPLVGNRLTAMGVLNDAMYRQRQRNTLIERPGNDARCASCPRYGQCPWKGGVYSAIWVGGEPKGIFGITATDESQARRMFSNLERIRCYSDIMAELLGGYTQAAASGGRKFFTFFDKEYTGVEALVCRNLQEDFHRLPQGGEDTEGKAGQRVPMARILTKDLAFMEFKKKAARAALFPSTILLTGETGTGKEVFARGIHQESGRREGPFVAVNCGAVPENLMESELFGHARGAFTGAYGEKRGKFLMAHGGTLFLDEVENMPLSLQQRLLRVLELREVEMLGGAKPEQVDIRVVAATNRPLRELVKAGAFREDLYHRLNVIPLHIPPLRERGEDALFLGQTFLTEFVSAVPCRARGLSEEAKKLLLSYPWPGNVRELKNAVEHGCCMCEGEEIGPEHLPEEIRAWQGVKEPAEGRGAGGNLLNPEREEREHLIKALSRFGPSEEGRLKAAASLGISRSTLYRRMKKYGVGGR